MKKQNARFNEDSEKLGGTPSSGYFLAKGREVPDADLITTSGTYQTDGDSLNLPSGAYSYGSLLVQSSGGDGIQIYIPNRADCLMYIRAIEDGIWHPWIHADARYLRNNGAYLPFDGTDRVFTVDEIGVWAMSAYNTEWTSVGYPVVSGSNAWTEIVIYQSGSGYGYQRVWGYSTSDQYGRTLYDGVWKPWEKIGGGGGFYSVNYNGVGNAVRYAQGVSGVSEPWEGHQRATFAVALPDANGYMSGIVGGGDGDDEESFLNFALLSTTVMEARSVRAADNSSNKNITYIHMIVRHPSITSRLHEEVDKSFISPNIGVIERVDGITIVAPSPGYTVQDNFNIMGEVGKIMNRSNLPLTKVFRNAWRLDSVSNTIYVDLAEAKLIAIDINRDTVKNQLKAIRPAWEEAVDNDDTVWMDQIKADRKDIRATLIAKISDINACTTVAEIEAYLP